MNEGEGEGGDADEDDDDEDGDDDDDVPCLIERYVSLCSEFNFFHVLDE